MGLYTHTDLNSLLQFEKCDNGPLGSEHQILPAEKSPGTPGFAALSTAPLMSPPLQPRLFIHMYICAIYSHRSGLQQPYSITCSGEPPKHLFAPTQNSFVSKGIPATQPTSYRPGTALKFSHFYNPDLFHLPCTGFNVAASIVLPKTPYCKITLWRNHLLLTILSAI